MEPSTIILLSGAGVVVIGVGIYIKKNRETPYKVFVKNKQQLYTLVKKLPEAIDVQKWTETIVDINSEILTKWWKNMLTRNEQDSNRITSDMIVQLKQWNIDTLWKISFDKKEKSERQYNLVSAKRALVNNIHKFSTLLPTLHRGISLEKWTEIVVDINDYDLTEFWKKVAKQPDVGKKMTQILSSWQIKSDTCKSFTCLTEDNVLAYQLPDGSKLEMGLKYKVESPCWIHTIENSDGTITKKILIKGVVTPKSEA